MLPTIREESSAGDYVIDIPVMEEKPVTRLDKTQTVLTTVVTIAVVLAIFSIAILAFNGDWDTLFAAGLVLGIFLCSFQLWKR